MITLTTQSVFFLASSATKHFALACEDVLHGGRDAKLVPGERKRKQLTVQLFVS